MQSYNSLYNYLVDFQFTQSAKQGLSSVYGTGKTAPRFGAQLFGNATVANAQRLTFTMPLLSGTVGLGSDRMLPIGALNDDIRLEVTWENNDTAVCYNTAATGTWTITNAELELQIVELSDEGQSMVESVTPFSQPVFLHGNSWRAYTSSFPANAGGGFSYLVPARFASLKGLVCLPKLASAQTSKVDYSVSSRINPNIATYWWRVGAYIIPNKYITLENANNTGGYAEAYMEVIKSFHSLSAPQYASGIQSDYYNVAHTANATIGGDSSTVGGVIAASTGLNAYKNAFAIAQECESFANRSDILISGMNTLASQIFFEGTVVTATNAAYSLSFFANYDQIIILENGILSAKF